MAKKKHQIVFNYPPPFPHDGDAEINGDIEANNALLDNVEAKRVTTKTLDVDTVISRDRLVCSSITICDDSGYLDERSSLHVDGCISLSPVKEPPVGRSFKNGYLFDMDGDLFYKRLDDKIVNLSECITLFESNGKGIDLFSEGGKRLKTITAKDGIDVYTDDNNIQISLSNQVDSAANIGSVGEGIFTSVSGRTALFKKIAGGENIELGATGKTITVSYSGRGFIRLVSTDVVKDKKLYSNIVWSTQGGYSNAHASIEPKGRKPYGGIILQITNLREGQEYTLYVTNKSKKVCRPFDEMVVYYGYGNTVTDKRAAKLTDVENIEINPGESAVVKMISTVDDEASWSFYIDSISKLIKE